MLSQIIDEGFGLSMLSGVTKNQSCLPVTFNRNLLADKTRQQSTCCAKHMQILIFIIEESKFTVKCEISCKKVRD